MFVSRLVPHSRVCGESVSIFSAKTAQDARQFFGVALLVPFRSQMHLSGVKLDPFKTLKVHFDSALQSLWLSLPHSLGSVCVCVCPFSALKTALDTWDFSF